MGSSGCNNGEAVFGKRGLIKLCGCLLPVIDAHDTEEQIHDPNVAKTEFLHFCRHAALSRIMLQGFQDVSVGRGVAAKEPAEHRNKQAKIREVTPAQESIIRFSKLQNNETSTRLRHTKHFTQTLLPAGQIP